MNSEKLKAHQHNRDQGREDLAGEHPLGDTVQLILGLVFLIIWVLDTFVFRYTVFLSGTIPFYIRLTTGSIVLIGSFMMARSGLKTVFGETRENPHVIKTGMFSIVRHPIYLSVILLYLGMIIISFSLASFALWLIIILFYRYISAYEERLLIQAYGDKYIDYRKMVPMLFPFRFRNRG